MATARRSSQSISPHWQNRLTPRVEGRYLNQSAPNATSWTAWEPTWGPISRLSGISRSRCCSLRFWIRASRLSQGFEAYVVETFSGATLDGVLGPQTSTAITLKHEEGKQDVVQRKDIRNMYAANLSAMPADLEKQIGLQQMADLLEFVKTSH